MDQIPIGLVGFGIKCKTQKAQRFANAGADLRRVFAYAAAEHQGVDAAGLGGTYLTAK